jgi:hypothetical protein
MHDSHAKVLDEQAHAAQTDGARVKPLFCDALCCRVCVCLNLNPSRWRTHLSRQMQLIDVIHQGRAGVPKAELTEKVAKMFKVKDHKTIVLFGLKSCTCIIELL